MFSNISEKYKFYVILSLAAITLTICYKVAFRSTIDIIKQYRELKIKAEIAKDIPEKTANFKKQLEDINSKFFTKSEGQLNSHELILEKISPLINSNSVKLIEFPAKQTYQRASVEVETHIILLNGSYFNLLKVLHDLELSEQNGRIVSTSFYSEIDRKTKRRNLFAKIYIQNYRNLKDNEN